MQLEGKLFCANRVVRLETINQADTTERFVPQLERALLHLCRKLEIPLPIWMDKNTREFARFHQTVFFQEQFMETVRFDRLQIRWLETK